MTGRTGRITVVSQLDFTASKGLRLPKWNNAGRPGSPEIGFTGYNYEQDVWEVYNGSQWIGVDGELE